MIRRNKFMRMALAAGAAGLLSTGFAHADAKMFAARVAGSDVEALVSFYASAFGLKEVQRVEAPNLLEIMMNFGDSVDAAKANSSPRIIVMRAANAAKDTVAHLLLNVTDMNEAIAAVKAAGGSVPGKTIEFGQAHVLITFAMDPAGNQIEMIQMPKR